MRRRKLGFTLVEVAIVVVVVGVLGAVGTVVYLRHRRHVRMSEATSMITMIRAEQEAFKTERGVYARVSSGVDAFYPAATPDRFATEWGGPCTSCISPNAWEQLPVRPSGPVMYGYATVAGVGGNVGGAFANGPAGPAEVNTCQSIAPDQPFYVVKAQGDVDGDGIASSVLGVSCSNALVLTNQGE